VKLSITGAALDKAAAWAARIAPAKPSVPVNACVLINAGPHELELQASDFDVFGQVSVDAEVSEPGKVVVSARWLAGIAKELNSGDNVSIETGGRGVELRVKRYQASWSVMNIEDWPHWPELGDPIGTIPADSLSRGIARVLPAVSNDSTVPVLTGMEFGFADVLTLAATDRFRVATAELSWQPTLGIELHKLIVPAGLLGTMRDVIGSGDVALYSDGSMVSIAAGRHRVTGRLIDGKPKNWQALIVQKNTATTVAVDVAALSRAVKRVAAGAEGKIDKLRLTITEEEVEVALAANPGEDAGDAGDSVELVSFAGEPVTFGVHHSYLRDALACIDSPTAMMRIPESPPKSFLLFAADDQGDQIPDGYRHLLVVTRLQEAVAVAA
jgi:DNA polymerase III subunit beta